jgi:ribosomal protein S18 acetylase RimI-like enzyme
MNLPTTHAYLMVLSDRLWHPNDIFKQYPDINKIFLFHSLGVHPDYRRNGIAKQLVTKGFEVCKYLDGFHSIQSKSIYLSIKYPVKQQD